MAEQAAVSLANRDSNSRDFVPKDASYTSFSGTDIIPIIYVPTLQGNISRQPFYVIGEIQTISYSIHRDKVPVKAFGFKNPKGFSRGARVLAGSLVFAVFDRHVFYDILQDLRFYSTGNDPKKPLAERSLFSDDLPPFDVLIHASNESGHQSNMLIRGVTIVDEGKVMSVEDIYTECTMSYFARDIEIFGPGDNFPEIAKNLIDTTVRQDVLPVDKPVVPSVNLTETFWNMIPGVGGLLPPTLWNMYTSIQSKSLFEGLSMIVTGSGNSIEKNEISIEKEKLKKEITQDDYDKKISDGDFGNPSVNTSLNEKEEETQVEVPVKNITGHVNNVVLTTDVAAYLKDPSVGLPQVLKNLANKQKGVSDAQKVLLAVQVINAAQSELNNNFNLPVQQEKFKKRFSEIDSAMPGIFLPVKN